MANAVHWYKVANYAVAGIEMALLDIKGKALDTPLANLLGGIYRDEAEFDGYLFIESPEVNAKQAAGFVQEHGFKQLKMKVGHNVDEDTRRLAAVRDAVGDDIKIRVDVNQEWSPSTAIKAINRMAEFDLQFVEQPTLYWDLEGMAHVQRSVDVPIAAHESCMTPLDAIKCVEHDCCEIFIVDTSDSGGVLKAKQIVDIANAAGKWCVLGTWIENGIASAANLHLIASSRNFPFANDTPFLLKSDDIIREEFKVVEGKVSVPTAPGLGVTLDEEKIEKYEQDAAEISRFGEKSLSQIPQYGKIL
jgi:L-alanine-DL-glutamate epimerase-like enolase superfamily enzyme